MPQQQGQGLLISSLQQRYKQILALRPGCFNCTAVRTCLSVRMDQLPNNFQKSWLAGPIGNLTSEQTGVRGARHIARREGTAGSSKHRQVWFLISNPNYLSFAQIDKVKQGSQSNTFVSF